MRWRTLAALVCVGVVAQGCNAILDNQEHPSEENSLFDASADGTVSAYDGGRDAVAADSTANDATRSGDASDGASRDAGAGEAASDAAAGEAASDAAAPECSSGSTRCNGLQPETCDTNGQWNPMGAACPNLCNNGSCAGVCIPNALRCNGLQPQTCDSTGLWGNTGAPCPSTCSGGSCSGVCAPSATQCSGLEPQLCDPTGQWQDAGAPCAAVCNAGSCAACAAGGKQCNGLQPQACNDAGAWQDAGTVCPFACDHPTGACTGVCAPTSARCNALQPQTCDSTGQWGNNGKACSFVCDSTSGACTGVCTPGSKQCNGTAQPQTCDTNGQWQNDTTTCTGCSACSNSTGACAPTTGPTCDDGNACTVGDACQSGTCRGVAVMCETPPNTCQQSNGTCNPSTGACTYPSVANSTPCNVNGNACTPGTCQGGACSPGTAVTCTASNSCEVAGTCSTSTGQCSAQTPASTTATCTTTGASSAKCDGMGNCLAVTCASPLVDDKGVCKTSNCMGVACGGSDGAGGTCTGANGTCAAGSGLHCSSAGTCVCDSTSCAGCCSSATTCVPIATQSATTNCGTGGATCMKCTLTNKCMQAVACVSGACVQSDPMSCGTPPLCRSSGTCDPTTGSCTFPPVNNQTACEINANACTPGTCQSGACSPSAPVMCTATDQCHIQGTCSASTGKCSAQTVAPSTTVCTTAQHATSALCDGLGNCKAVTCAAGFVNNMGTCQVPNCAGVACGGSDGAGGLCVGTSGTCTQAGQHCNSTGQCVCDATSCAGCCGATGTCNTTLSTCASACVNEQTDKNNCGACGHACAISCVGGQCVLPTQISAGVANTCARLSDGTVRCWGDGHEGELGNTTVTSALKPIVVNGPGGTPLTGVNQVSEGNEYACAVRSDTTMDCWGLNSFGELGIGVVSPPGGFVATPTAVGNVTGSPLTGTTAVVTSIADTIDHTCAVDGSNVLCWGTNDLGELGNGMAVGMITGIATPQGVLTPAGAALVGATGVAVGQFMSCALLSNGGVDCWGEGGQLGNGSTQDSTTAVAVLNAAGTASLTGATALAGGPLDMCAIVSGTVMCWGGTPQGNFLLPTAVSPPLSGVVAITVGGSDVCALVAGGAIDCWGLDNTDGELGNGTTTTSTTPVAVMTAAGTPLTGATAVSAGLFHTCALMTGGTIMCWGNNLSGQLGNGTTSSSLNPVAVTF